MLVAIKHNSTQITQQTLSLSSPRNLVVTVRLDEGREKSIKIKDIKREKGSLLFLPERKVYLYFLKTKTTNFHKVINFKRNKLYKIRLCIFFPMLVENIELDNKNYIHSSNDNIITKQKKKKGIKKYNV